MKDYSHTIKDVIQKYLPHAKVYLFGSRARNDNHSTSDFDLALDNSEEIERRIIAEIYEEIDSLNIPYSFDIIDFNSADEMMQKQIRESGILW